MKTPKPQSENIRYRAIPIKCLTSGEIETWSRIVAGNPALGSPFFAPEYALAVASSMVDVHVGIMEIDHRPVAFMPFEPGSFRVAKKVFLADYDGIICDQGLDLDVTAFLKGCGIRAWDFKFLRFPQIQVRGGRPLEYSLINLESGFDDYVADRKASSNQIKMTMRLARKLAREVGPLRFEPHTNSEKLLLKLMEWKETRYGKSHRPTDKVLTTLTRLLNTQCAGCSGTLSVLFAGDTVIALVFGLCSRNTWHCWFSAFNPQHPRYSTGVIILLKIAECAAGLGIKDVDLGCGAEYEYKIRLRNGSGLVMNGSIVSSHVLSAFRSIKKRAKVLLKNRALRNSPMNLRVKP